MARKKSVAQKSFASISMSINGIEFHAEGDSVEVQKKFRAWLEQTLSPIKTVKALAEKTLAKEKP